MKDLYLYHATDKKNLKSIMKNGLLVNPPTHNWKGIYCDNMIFLAFDAYVAEDYAMSSDNTQDDIDIVVLKVHLNDLNADNIYYDWNNRCEYMNEINSCAYTLDIPSSNLQICNPKDEPSQSLQICNPKDEPSQSIYDFEGSYLFDIISYTFDVKVETNLKNQEES